MDFCSCTEIGEDEVVKGEDEDEKPCCKEGRAEKGEGDFIKGLEGACAEDFRGFCKAVVELEVAGIENGNDKAEA